VFGTNAGMVLVVGVEDIADIVAAYGYTSLFVKGESGGLRIL